MSECEWRCCLALFPFAGLVGPLNLWTRRSEVLMTLRSLSINDLALAVQKSKHQPCASSRQGNALFKLLLIASVTLQRTGTAASYEVVLVFIHRRFHAGRSKKAHDAGRRFVWEGCFWCETRRGPGHWPFVVLLIFRLSRPPVYCNSVPLGRQIRSTSVGQGAETLFNCPKLFSLSAPEREQKVGREVGGKRCRQLRMDVFCLSPNWQRQAEARAVAWSGSVF